MGNLTGESADAGVPAVKGKNTASAPGGNGGWFESSHGEGVRGVSRSGHAGVVGINNSPDPRFAPVSLHDESIATLGGNGGWFESNQGEGVRGTSKNANHGGVVGVNTGGGIAVYGNSDAGVGVSGTSVNAEGVLGNSKNGRGVVGVAIAATGVEGNSTSGAGVFGSSQAAEGVHAETHSKGMSALAAYQKDPQSDGAALYAEHADPNRTAAFFKGNLIVTGDISLVNADCAEDFDISDESSAEPGTVMVLDDESKLRESHHAYDKRVAGVISGAGYYKPGLVLDKQESQQNRKPIALLGKVFCKVDAQFGAIEVGDLLTTSPTPGHAMKTSDPLKAFGAVIGKALRPLADGQGLIPILIALQ